MVTLLELNRRRNMEFNKLNSLGFSSVEQNSVQNHQRAVSHNYLSTPKQKNSIDMQQNEP